MHACVRCVSSVLGWDGYDPGNDLFHAKPVVRCPPAHAARLALARLAPLHSGPPFACSKGAPHTTIHIATLPPIPVGCPGLAPITGGTPAAETTIAAATAAATATAASTCASTRHICAASKASIWLQSATTCGRFRSPYCSMYSCSS